MASEGDARARMTAEAILRQSYGKLVAFLAARTHDVAGAEDALSDALATALVQWPARGVPENPEAWLMTVARRKLMDASRRRRTRRDASDHLRLIAEELEAAAMETPVPDERLALMFACAHPAIDSAIRAPLILQTILGLDGAAIASAYLVAPSAMAQRLVRAKTKIREAAIPFRLPDAADLRPRLDAVLEAIYGAFASGWADPAGTEFRRRNLAEEAIGLGRLVAALLPDEPEALGLVALMLHAEARRGARRSDDGEYVPLSAQDPRLWDHGLIDEAEATLRRAGTMNSIGRYQLEAAVQSAHVVRRHGGTSDFAAIDRLYGALAVLTESPVVIVNQAIARAETRGPAAALALLDRVAADRRLSDYQPYWAARADLLARAGDGGAADQAYGLAIGLESDPAVRRFLQMRRAALAHATL